MVAEGKRSPFIALMALCVLALSSFVAGMLGGIAWEQPRLLVAYVVGDTTEIEWLGESQALSDVASGPGGTQVAIPEVPALEEAPEEPVPEVPAVSASPRPRGPVAEPKSRIAIQVGAFESSDAAERLVRELRSREYTAYVVAGSAEDRPRWRVRVGPVSNRKDAATMAERLKREERLPTWIMEEVSGSGL